MDGDTGCLRLAILVTFNLNLEGSIVYFQVRCKVKAEMKRKTYTVYVHINQISSKIGHANCEFSIVKKIVQSSHTTSTSCKWGTNNEKNALLKYYESTQSND